MKWIWFTLTNYLQLEYDNGFAESKFKLCRVLKLVLQF